MVHPEYRLHRDRASRLHLAELTPVYPATLGLTSGRIRKWVERRTRALRRRWSPARLPDMQFADLMTAIRFLHAPSNDQDRINAARERVVLDELTGHYLVMKRRQALSSARPPSPLPPGRDSGGNCSSNSVSG